MTDELGDPLPELSVVVVAYDMRRELPRTLRSLSPEVQQGVEAEQYELLVVDNGSPEPLDERLCDAFGARVRLLEVERPSPSPAEAANLGLSEAVAPLVGVFIDGARLASPGMLRHALAAARLHRRPVIATLNFHLGRELQSIAITHGYDQAAEDALLAEIEWPSDAYRLFEISVPGGSSRPGWFLPPAESNAVFMPAELWQALGGFDEAFAIPGGGLVNLDLFKRACELPDTQLLMLLGEATFHQVHGGAVTGSSTSRWDELNAEYEAIRGEPFSPPRVEVIQVGSPSPQALASVAESAARMAARPLPEPHARRYIELLKSALLNETALEAEAAYFLARDAAEDKGGFDERFGYDVGSARPERMEQLREARFEGRHLDRDLRNVGFGYTMIGRLRLDNLDECVSSVLAEGIPGDLVECGVWRGGAAILMRALLWACEDADRSVWLADSFEGLPRPKPEESGPDLSADNFPQLAVSRQQVAENFARFDLLDERVRFLEGWFADTLPEAPIETIAVLRLDGDLYESTLTPLVALYEKLSPGGFVIVDDYGVMRQCRKAVDEFRSKRGIDEPLEWVDRSGVYWRKAGSR